MNLLKGEITVEQGKALNEELKHDIQEQKKKKSLPPVQQMSLKNLSI